MTQVLGARPEGPIVSSRAREGVVTEATLVVSAEGAIVLNRYHVGHAVAPSHYRAFGAPEFLSRLSPRPHGRGY